MKIKKALKKLSSLLFTAGMVLSCVHTPIIPVQAQDSEIRIDVSGHGTVLVTQDDQTEKVTESTTITGTAGEMIHVEAKAADGEQITAFAVYTDTEQHGFAYGDTPEKVFDAQLGKEKYIAVDFGMPSDQPDGGIQPFASQADYDRLQPGATGSGQWWTSNQDMFAQQFPISWIHGDLEPFAQFIVGKSATCIDPGHIGVTDNNPYGIKTLGYTFRVTGRDASNITVEITSDVLRKADGTPATGWSAALGRVDTYQRFALTVQIPVPSRTIHVNLTKESADLQLTQGNNCYSLANASYGVYKDPGCGQQIGTITTGGDGRGSVAVPNMDPGMKTVYLKELKAPKGYILNPEVITVNLDGNGNGNAVSKEKAGNDPLRIMLNKLSEDGQYVQNAPSLEGAEFTVKYYAGMYDKLESLPAQPTRTWVIKTLRTEAGIDNANLDDAHKVSGDDFYRTEAGNVTLPLGTVTVQETKAPEGYTLEGASYSVNNGTVNQKNGMALFNIKDKGNGSFGMVGGNEYTVTEKAERSGSFSIKKQDAETAEQVQGGATGLSAAFKLTNDNDFGAVLRGQDGSVLGKAEAHQDFDYTIHTDAKGNWTSPDGFLPFGTYTLTEIAAPEGYLISEPSSQQIMIQEDHQTVTLNPFKDQIIRGGFKVQKHDTDTGLRPQGTNTNLQMSFKIVSDNDNPVVVEGHTYNKGETVFKSKTDENGYYESAADLLPYGTYTLKETKAPNGYTDQGATQTQFTVSDNGAIVDLTQGQIHNTVQLGGVALHKVLTGVNGTNWVANEAGAVFGVVKADAVAQYGSVADALAHQYGVTVDEIHSRDWLTTNLFANTNTADTINKDGSNADLMTGHEYAVIRTAEDGNATTGEHALAYGDYVVAQLASGDDEITCTDATYNVTVDADGKVIELQATNLAESYYLRMVKKDADTGKLSTLNSAEFKIYQLTNTAGQEVNQYVTQTVGGKKYDTFRTSSENGGHGRLPQGTFYGAGDDPATVTTPLKLEAGTYRIEEVATPDGFLGIDPIEIEIKKASISETDEEGNNFITVTIANPRAWGELELHKTIKDVATDKDCLPNDVLQQIEFTLTAKKDVVDPDDGSILTKKGAIAKDIHGKEVGRFHLDEQGHALISKIALGEYTLTETNIPSSLALNKKTWDVAIAQNGNDTTTQKYTVTLDIDNKPTVIELSKKAVTGSDELPGAKLQVIEKDTGNVVDEWVSGETSHVIKGLDRAKTYIMHEVVSPNEGEFVKATDIEFTVNEDGTVSTVTMIDKLVNLEKVDEDGNFVEGAQITVTDVDGNVVDQWTSDGETAHKVHGLEVGKTYTVSETVVPEGYVKFKDFTFTAEDNGKDQTIRAVDKRVWMDKTDGEGNELPGAHVQIIDMDGNIVDEWVSGDAPHAVSGLEVGKTYTWHEDYLDVVGYYYADDYTFTVTDDGLDQEFEMVDHPIRYQVAKVDDNGEYVSGVTLKITDITDADNPVEIELPNEGVTGKDPMMLDKLLTPEHTYVLEETAYIPGVHPAESIQFTVPKFGTSEVTTITMLDRLTGIRVQKIDNHGKPVAGAKMQILATETDESGNVVSAKDENGDPVVVYEFESTEDVAGIDVSKYLKGAETYILHEVEAPFGFELAPDTVFTVDGTQDKVQVISVTDKRKTYYVSAIKVDAQDNKKLLKGAEITLFRPDGTVATDVNGNECVGMTDGEGVITWHVEYNDDMDNGGYYVKETGAPAGYRINPNKFDVKLSEDYDFAQDNAIRIVVNDEALPTIVTGVKDNPAAWGAMFAAALGTAVIMIMKRR